MHRAVGNWKRMKTKNEKQKLVKGSLFGLGVFCILAFLNGGGGGGGGEEAEEDQRGSRRGDPEPVLYITA